MTRLGGLGGLVLGLSLVASRSVSSFEITRVEQTDQNLEPGQTARLVCRASQDWEFCQWRLSQTSQVLQLCSLEWKLIKGGVTIQDCSQDLRGRVSIAGDYDKRECGLEIRNLSLSDSGTWECEMEEYQLGDWSSGEKHQAQMTLNVRPLRPTEHPILIERISSPEGRFLSALTEGQISTTDVAVTSAMSAANVSIDAMDATPDEITLTDDADSADYDYDYLNGTDIADIGETRNGTTKMSRVVTSGVSDEPQASDMIISVSLSAGTLIVFIAVGVVFWLRKNKTNLALASRLDDHNWIVTEIADMSMATMSDLMTRQND